MEDGDRSLWHYLIFCEEYVSDVHNDVCWVCQKWVWEQPAFKCLECSFVQHKSCPQLPDLIETNVKHDIRERHHLILREETEKNEKEKAVCGGCGKLVSGLTYRCSVPQCTFHLHKSCDQLSHAIQHIVHPDHTLFLRLPSPSVFCDLCAKYERITPLLYACRPCNFDVDIECVSRWRITVDKCHPHAFIASRKPNKFTCEACGEEAEDIVYHCSDCRVWIHRWCSRFPTIIRIYTHHHSVSRTYCLRQVKKVEKAICKICCEKVNTECGGYYCQECDYIVHMKCAEITQEKSTTNFKATEFDDYAGHLVYLIEGLNVEEDKTAGTPLKINHRSDSQHKLVLSHEDPGNDKRFFKNNKRCEACMQFIVFPPFYSCEDCNIFVHRRCVKLPETIRRLPFDQNIQKLSPSQPSSTNQNIQKLSPLQPSSTNQLSQCRICKCRRHGLFYKSEDTSYDTSYDVQCFLIPETINHESHGHSLHVHIQPNVRRPENLYWIENLPSLRMAKNCIGCGGIISPKDQHLMCSDCKFNLCFKCATLPLVARYKCHPHLLKLTYTCEDDLEESYCLICEEKLDSKHWFYSCAACDFPAHIQCVIGSSLKSGKHEHPVILVEKPKDSLECHLCETSIKDKIALECIQCKFNFHIKCYY